MSLKDGNSSTQLFKGIFCDTAYVTLRENDGRLLRQCRVLDFATPAWNNCKNCTAALAANKNAFRSRRRETERDAEPEKQTLRDQYKVGREGLGLSRNKMCTLYFENEDSISLRIMSF